MVVWSLVLLDASRSEMRGYHIHISLKPHYSPESFVPSGLFHQLPLHKPKPTSRRNALSNPANKDYRLGPVRLDWVDFEVTEKPLHTAMGKERAQQGRGWFFGMSRLIRLSILLRSCLCATHSHKIWVH